MWLPQYKEAWRNRDQKFVIRSVLCEIIFEREFHCTNTCWAQHFSELISREKNAVNTLFFKVLQNTQEWLLPLFYYYLFVAAMNS